jgi:urease subunit alpha
VTTFVAQDFGPVWNLGANPAACLATAWAALEGVALNVAFLVRASSSRPAGVEESLRAGGAGLKIHEDVAAGPEQLRCALDVADRHDVQLAIHTDGLNEALCAADTAGVLAGRTVHLYHIEGVGGGHAPDLLTLAGRERMLTSSTNPTVPFGVGAEAEHLAMVAAVHVLEPQTRPGDTAILRLRVRPWTMAAESVLHDLGVIAMLSSDSQGMGRVGETVRRAFQCAAVMKAQRGAGSGPADNDRVLRYLAKVTINPAVAQGLSADVGSLRPGRLADLVLWPPAHFAVRPELVLKAGMPAWGASGSGDASTMMVEPVRVGPQIAATGAAPARVSLAFLAGAAMDADIPTTRERARVSGCRDLTAADMVRNARTGTITVDAGSRSVSLDGDPLTCAPAAVVPYSGRYLL